MIPEYFDTIVIGAGQAGLSVGYHLRNKNIPFMILDANERVGDAWRKRWDSLRLFTPARFNGLDGMKFPAPAHYFPTKDEMGDFLEAYYERFQLPVRTGTSVTRLSRADGRFMITTNRGIFEADNVVVAMGRYQEGRVPSFARELDAKIVQIHSSDYRSPSQLQAGDVLIVGAANSGAEIAMETAKTHKTWLSGRDVGHIPFNVAGLAGRLFLVWFVLRFLFLRVLTIKTPFGRRARPEIIVHGGPLIRQKPASLKRAGVVRVPRMKGVSSGKPCLEDGRILDVRNVIWCTGFQHQFPWIDLPVQGKDEPLHKGGVVEEIPGLYFVGLHFQYSLASAMVHGVGRDAEYVVRILAERRNRYHIPVSMAA